MLFAVSWPSTRYPFSESEAPPTWYPAEPPFEHPVGEQPPVPEKLLYAFPPIKGSLRAEGANWMTDWKDSPCGISLITSSVTLVIVRELVTSICGAALLTSTTSEVVPTSSAMSTEGRWPTSRFRPSRLTVLKPLVVTVRV